MSQYRWILFSSFLLTFSSFFSGNSLAQSPPSKKPSNQKIWLRISLVDAMIWPTKSSGQCWDFCRWQKPKLPRRQLLPYETYLKNPLFKKWTKGWAAPDIRVHLLFGSSLLYSPLKKNTTIARWKASWMLRLAPSDPITIKVFDIDPLKEELIGKIWFPKLPDRFWKGGLWTIRKFGQVERLTLKIIPITEPRRFALKKKISPYAEKKKPPKKQKIHCIPMSTNFSSQENVPCLPSNPNPTKENDR